MYTGTSLLDLVLDRSSTGVNTCFYAKFYGQSFGASRQICLLHPVVISYRTRRSSTVMERPCSLMMVQRVCAPAGPRPTGPTPPGSGELLMQRPLGGRTRAMATLGLAAALAWCRYSSAVRVAPGVGVCVIVVHQVW